MVLKKRKEVGKDAQEWLGYEDYIYLGDAISVREHDNDQEWEREFQEELMKQPLDDIE
ncbi:hypothetical protein VBD025_00770 [Virgibacillus flavescens]|uniref:hypothetical protein n=1 Tax=Virgibacillus flavescens TaxID=1611422 RepID=UPI003D33A481